jgi:Zn-dependent M28 family amino/carboxypeptidase
MRLIVSLCVAGLIALPAIAKTLQVSEATIREHTRTLSDDRFEGRGPASPAEPKTIAYIADAFAKAGLKPGGENGTWFQKVPLVRITADPSAAFTIEGGANGPMTLNYMQDMVVWTKRQVDRISVEKAPLVFVGYGVNAPEYGWNDYAGVDVRGKAVVMLVNDPGFATRDPKLFNGKAMTYYGRWTYKYEEAMRQGAAMAILVHDTAAAAYPWAVVTNSWTGGQLDLAHADKSMGRVKAEAWITTSAALRLFAAAGHDFLKLKVAAHKRGFKAVPLGLTVSTALSNTLAYSDSHNVVGILPGRERPNEYVLQMAHWDHLGRGLALNGDDIYNGAVDNASGTAALIAIAEAAAKAPPTARSQVFLAWTAEESGLLGSAWYAANPLYPLNQTVAGINMDGMNMIGRAANVVVVGYGKSELEPILKRYARRQGRTVEPEPTPESGFFYRSDHFSLAKVGVPMLYADSGQKIVGKPKGWGDEQARIYVADYYHKPSDEYRETMDFSGAREDAQLFLDIGLDIASSKAWPNWYPSAEFRTIRDASLAKPAAKGQP